MASSIPVDALLSKEHAAVRSQQIDLQRAAASVEPSRLDGFTNSAGHDTIYLCAIDSQGNIASLIQSIYSGFGSGLVPKGTGFALHNRGALFTLEPDHPNTLMPRKRPLHTIIPGFMEKDGVRIGFHEGADLTSPYPFDGPDRHDVVSQTENRRWPRANRSKRC